MQRLQIDRTRTLRAVLTYEQQIDMQCTCPGSQKSRPQAVASALSSPKILLPGILPSAPAPAPEDNGLCTGTSVPCRLIDCSAKCFLLEKGLPWMMDTLSPTIASARSSVVYSDNAHHTGETMQPAKTAYAR
jgi:hypothetical protein